MPAKKAPAKQERTLPSISARIDRLVDLDNSKVKAIASVNIGDAFAIHGVKVVDSQNGLFVQMPQTSYEKDGKKHYSDQFHPITAEARTAFYDSVFAAYDERVHMDEDESQAMDDPSEDSALTQSM